MRSIDSMIVGLAFKLGRDDPGSRFLRTAIAMDRRKVRRYFTDMKTTVSSKGQIVIPAELRAQDKITAGEQFEVERIKPGEYLLRKVKMSGKPGLLKLLLDCPEKDWVQDVA